MRAQLLHLSGPYRGRTITYDATTIILGSASDAAVRYPQRGDMCERHAEIEFVEEGCAFYLRALDGKVFVNRQEVSEIILQHGDLVEVGLNGPKFRFRIAESGSSVCKPVHQMLSDAVEVHGESGFWASTHGLRRDLIFHSSLGTKIVAIFSAVVIVFGAAYVGGALSGNRAVRRQQKITDKQAELYRRQIEGLEQQIEEFRHDQAGNASQKELQALRADLEVRANVIDDIAKRSEALQRVLNVYSRGVCLIHGIYTFDGMVDGQAAQVADASGKPVELEYIGSGFLADRSGRIITNRHVAEPWWNNEYAAPLLAQDLTPRFVSLDVVFPGMSPTRADPKTIQISDEDVDVAMIMASVDSSVPVLPLHEGDLTAMRGDRVILLGYPTGLNALLARCEPKVVEEVLAGATSTETLITALAKRNIISPVITQGSLNEVRPKRLVYDAETTSGGSGGPVFGSDGSVIGINFAITRDFDGSNFGIPIEFASRLLRQ